MDTTANTTTFDERGALSEIELARVCGGDKAKESSALASSIMKKKEDTANAVIGKI